MNRAYDKGASAWLNALPIVGQKLQLNKQEFRDGVRLRYNLPIENLPSRCPCGERFNVTHALTCKKVGFVSQRHDAIRNLFTSLLENICIDVEAEPHLTPIRGGQMILKTANTKDDARLDIKARSFWQRGETAFFDVRITHVDSLSQKGMATEKIFRNHEQEKRREYMQRVIEVEGGSFTPLVFGTNGGAGVESERFMSILANCLAEKEGGKYAETISWIRTRVSFEILRSTVLCVRGSRTPFRRYQREDIGDFSLMEQQYS